MRAGAVAPPPAQGMVLQMLAEPLPWNWPVPALGMTPAEAYALFDAIPASISGVTYVPSAMSFSRNYAAWLELLRPDALPSLPTLASELAANRPPTNPGGPLPPGWTRVNTLAEGLVARPAWTIPIFPSDWVLSVPRSPMSLGVADSVAPASAPMPPPATTMLKAAAWGAIPVTPGSWFDGARLAMARLAAQPYNNPALSQAQVLGEGGLLSCRVAEFIVMLDPGVQMDLAPGALPAGEPLRGVSLGGLRWQAGAPVAGTMPAELSVDRISDQLVRVQARANGADRAFIVALYVEPMLH